MAKILLFAQARQAAGCGELEWPNTEGQGPKELWNWLIERYPSLAAIRACCRLACNGVYVTPDVSFEPFDEIALIPPVSGG